MPDLTAIFESMNMGLVTLDRSMRVLYWNPWMARFTGIPADRITGSLIFDHFPGLDTQKFHRSRRAVLTFGTYAYFSQKLHGYLFPCPLKGSLARQFPFMQQNCTMGPIREPEHGIHGLYILVQDVTELAFHEKQLQDMSTHDALTGMMNRRYLDSRLQDEVIRAMRYSRPLSLMIVDIDHFKDVNDHWGHQAGDSVLKELADRLQPLIRITDCLARFGGEEFCCVLPETAMGDARILSERFLQEVSETPFQAIQTSLTISIGLTEYITGDSPQELIHRADAALYEAKHAGRNCLRMG